MGTREKLLTLFKKTFCGLQSSGKAKGVKGKSYSMTIIDCGSILQVHKKNEIKIESREEIEHT